MTSVIYVILGSIALIILISLLWRLLSRKFALPCPAWLGWLVELDNPFAKAAQARIIIENLDLKPGMKVIDIGCGPGRITIPLAKKMGPEEEVVAMDIQEGILDRIRQKALDANLHNIIYLQAGIGEGRLTLNHYDHALLVSVLGEIPDQKAALQEIFNVLKQGGILSITETIFDPHYQSKESIIQLANAIGFREKKIFGNRIAFTLQLQKP